MPQSPYIDVAKTTEPCSQEQSPSYLFDDRVLEELREAVREAKAEANRKTASE